MDMTYSRCHKRSRLESLGSSSLELYKFRVLLPSGEIVDLILRDPGKEMFVGEFVDSVRQEYLKSSKKPAAAKREILWDGDIYLEDMEENKFGKRIFFRQFNASKLHILKLHDGAKETIDTYQNMWDLTPDTELLLELPAQYTFETALADLIDNSLQAVWSNGVNERKLVSVTIDEERILIFDTGPGMDSSDGKSIVKWGKFGSSNHRTARGLAIGGKPPYLMPLFGMFGYGGPIATMHLRRRALVSSKTKESKKVFTLYLEREALLSKSASESIWNTAGGIRSPFEDEVQLSPHGSFTKVEIQVPNFNQVEFPQLPCRLKDIYFPYIQCDDVHSCGRTATPIEFQVNGVNLAEIEGGEVAITNWYSSNGPEFVLQLRFVRQEIDASSSGDRKLHEANARLKCVYFPIVEGKESIDKILEKIEVEGGGIGHSFENFSRVSIRRLGRLLPDARWARLPFMEPRQKKGDKLELLKRCCKRVKCFVETDAGFSPNPSKTDLAHHDSFTTALRGLGNSPSIKGSEQIIKIYNNDEPLNLLKLEKDYQDWLFQMHEKYDEEIDCGVDQPVLVVNPQNRKRLGIRSDVIRVHRAIRRKDVLWRSGQYVKILRGTVGCLKSNLYATLEYVMLEGFQGDSGGEARLICRPINCPVEKGCLLEVNGETAILDIQDSLSFPIGVIDSGKCQTIDSDSWKYQLEKLRQKSPSAIEILSADQCRRLDVDGALVFSSQVSAGFKPPKEIVAVVRPGNFIVSGSSKSLEKKHIVQDDLEMLMEIKYIANTKDSKIHPLRIDAQSVKPTSRKGIGGLYIFPLARESLNLFHKAGVYKFYFSLHTNSNCKLLESESEVVVGPSSCAGKWGVLLDKIGTITSGKSLQIRVGSYVPHLSVAYYDEFYNRRQFKCTPLVNVKIKAERIVVHVQKMVVKLSSDKMTLQIVDMLVESSELDLIRPHYKATMEISSQDELLFTTVPCKVIPGNLKHVTMKESPPLVNGLLPGSLVEELLLELFDAYGNHVAIGVEVDIDADGFLFQDNTSFRQKVDEWGCVNLGGLLKVNGSYGEHVSLSVKAGRKIFFKKDFQVAKRELRIASAIPGCCVAGSQLENIAFDVIDTEGTIDEGIHDDATQGQFHTLSLTSESSVIDNTIRYTFARGRCIVPVIPIPHEEGMFRFLACHSHHSELCIRVEVSIVKAPKLELVSITKPHVDEIEAQCHSSNDGILFLPHASVFGSSHMHEFVGRVVDEEKKLEKDLAEAGLQIGFREKQLKILQDQKLALSAEIYDLQEVDSQSQCEFDYLLNSKEEVVKRIEAKADNAATVFFRQLESIELKDSQKCLLQDVIGFVALLGSVHNIRISRMLAEYLGEEYMLALVAKSYETAKALEKYSMAGNLKRNFALPEAAGAMKQTVNGRFLVICLEQIRPYNGQFEDCHPQKKLVLRAPLLPSGDVVPGFLGYAVNMITLDSSHLHTRTSAGYGLRETLFYLLFGELQVYETREDMQQASCCIKSGAISLDGGIIRGNGIISIGDWEPEIIFPLRADRHPSPYALHVRKKIQRKKAKMLVLEQEIKGEREAHEKALNEFRVRKEQFEMFLKTVRCLAQGS